MKSTGLGERNAAGAAARKYVARIRSGGRNASLILRAAALIVLVALTVVVIGAVRRWGTLSTSSAWCFPN